MCDADIFSPLYRWAHRQGENFTTEAFVAVIKVLLQREPSLAKRFLGWLCFSDESAFVASGGLPRIGTQMHSDEGAPDVYISDRGIFCLVEIKKGSDLHAGQLRRYHSILARREEAEKSLVLLTAFSATFDSDEKPHHERRWSDVADWLERNAPTDDITNWLVRELRTYLRRQVMTIDRVSWEYTEGTRSLINLTLMLGKALEQAGIPLHSRSAAWDSRGYYTKDKLFWVGIYMNQPQLVQFEFVEAKPDAARLKEQPGWMSMGKVAKSLDLCDEAVHFFALSKESQLTLLTTFLKNAYEAATRCVVPALG